MTRAVSLLVTTWLFLLSSISAGISQSMIIDTFKSNPEKNWQFFADTVMGGVSSGQMTFKTENGVSYGKMVGKVSTANNGGFIQMRRPINASPSKNITGFRLVVRGNNQRYYMHLRTSGTLLPWQYYQASYNVTDQWREIRIPLESFERSSRILRKVPRTSSIKSIAVVGFGRNHTADIEIKEVGFY